MKFIFLCPETGRTFETGDFRIIEGRGVVTDRSGRKAWDAGVTVICPFCEKTHTYRANELACPFTPETRPDLP
jgi:hypothetical protein